MKNHSQKKMKVVLILFFLHSSCCLFNKIDINSKLNIKFLKLDNISIF